MDCKHEHIYYNQSRGHHDQCLDCGAKKHGGVWHPLQLKCSDCNNQYEYMGKFPLPDFYQPRCPKCMKERISEVADIVFKKPDSYITRCVGCGGSFYHWEGAVTLTPYCTKCLGKEITKPRTPGKWETMAYRVCDAIAIDSKDESTKLGCVVLGPGHEIRSTGYNSFPRGCNDHVKARQERPLKYRYMAHAEENAIANAARMGVSLAGCSIYCQWPPCDRCARMIIGAGLKDVYCRDLDVPIRRTEEVIAACEMIAESSVELKYGELILSVLYERQRHGTREAGKKSEDGSKEV